MLFYLPNEYDDLTKLGCGGSYEKENFISDKSNLCTNIVDYTMQPE